MTTVNLSDMQEGGRLRQPRAWVNGIPCIECRVELVGMNQSSSFSAKIAADDPAGPGMGFWANIAAPIAVTITATNGDGGPTVPLFMGKIWFVEIDWEHRIAIVSGNDGAQDLINSRNDQAYPNQMTTAIVGQIAAQAGLGVVTNGAGSMAGRTYDNQNYQYNSDDQNSWDVIQDMAHQDGNVAFVYNNILYYVKPGSTFGGVYEIAYTPPSPANYGQSNAVHLVTKHDLHLAQGVSGETASWFPYSKQANVGSSGSGGKAKFYRRSPGLTMNQALKDAQNTSTLGQDQELRLEGWFPGDVVVNPTIQVVLTGTGSLFDVTYNIEHVSHDFSFDHGYMMMIQGKAPGGGAGGGSEPTFANPNDSANNNPNEPTFANTNDPTEQAFTPQPNDAFSTESTFANASNPNESTFASTSSPGVVTVQPENLSQPNIVDGPAPPSAFDAVNSGTEGTQQGGPFGGTTFFPP